MERLSTQPSRWNGRRALVTGPTGLLGGNLVRSLVDLGAEVTVLDYQDMWSPLFESVRHRLRVVVGDIRDPAAVDELVTCADPEVVFHLAARAHVEDAIPDPVGTYEINARGTWLLLESCRNRASKLQAIVVASTDKAYGETEADGATEDSRLGARFPYDASKLCADVIARSFAATYRMPLVVTRCGNLFGPGHLSFRRLVPGAMRAAFRQEPLRIRSDGTLLRDYLYVLDAVRGYLRLGESTHLEGVRGEAFNLASGASHSVLSLLDQISGITGVHIPPVIEARVTSEIQTQVLQDRKAKQVLGWEIDWPLPRALSETWAWYRQHLEQHPDADPCATTATARS